jgi:hypothetical protein
LKLEAAKAPLEVLVHRQRAEAFGELAHVASRVARIFLSSWRHFFKAGIFSPPIGFLTFVLVVAA